MMVDMQNLQVYKEDLTMYKANDGFEFDTKEKVEAFNNGGQFCFSGYDETSSMCRECLLCKECESCKQ